jgi:hypothetical protein
MSTTAFASANDERELQASNLFNQAFVIQGILINVNATPDARVVGTNRDDAKRRLDTIQMLLPKVVSWRFTDDNAAAILLPVPSRPFNFVGSMSDIQPGENRLEPSYVGHTFFLS